MSIKSLFTYTLFLALGIGAVTNTKALLIEQAPQPQEAAQTEQLAYRVSHAPNQWHRWTA